MEVVLFLCLLQPPTAPPVRAVWEWRPSKYTACVSLYRDGEQVGVWSYREGQYYGKWNGRAFEPSKLPDDAPAVPEIIGRAPLPLGADRPRMAYFSAPCTT